MCVSLCNGLRHGNVSMATWQRRQYGSLLLSWENLGSVCLVGNDDNSAKRWIKLNRGRLNPSTTSRCREWDDACVLFPRHFTSSGAFCIQLFGNFCMYCCITDSKSGSSRKRPSLPGQTSIIFNIPTLLLANIALWELVAHCLLCFVHKYSLI